MPTKCQLPTNSTIDIDYEQETAPVWIIVLDLTVSVLTIVLNILAFAVGVYAKSRTANFRNVHILFLSITDALAGVSLLPTLKTFIYPEAKLWYWDCFGRLFFFLIAIFNSIAQVFAICLNRLFLMSKPSWGFSSDYMSRYIWIIASTAGFSSIACVTIWLLFITPSESEEYITCRLSNVLCENEQRFVLVVGLALLILEMLVVICFLILVFILIRQKRKMRRIASNPHHAGQAQTNSEVNEDKMKKETKSIQIIAIIVVLLVICVTPQNVGGVANGLGMTNNLSRTTRHAVAAMTILNCAINPIIYCFMIPEIRQILRCIVEATGIM